MANEEEQQEFEIVEEKFPNLRQIGTSKILKRKKMKVGQSKIIMIQGRRIKVKRIV